MAELQKGIEKPKSAEESPLMLTDKMLEADFDEVFRQIPINDDTACGIGFIRGKFLQKYKC